MEKLFLTWEDIQQDVDNLCKKLQGRKFQFITGLPRGGLIPAVLISHKLDITYKSFHLDFYAREIPNDKWVVYPWENEKAETIQDYKLK